MYGIETSCEVGEVESAVDARQSMSVGRDHSYLFAIALNKHTVEVEARFVVADGKQSFVQHAAKDFRVDFGELDFAVIRNLWEVSIWHSNKSIIDFASLDFCPIVFSFFHGDFVAGHVCHDIVIGKDKVLVAATDLNVSVSAELSSTNAAEGGLTVGAKALHDVGFYL